MTEKYSRIIRSFAIISAFIPLVLHIIAIAGVRIQILQYLFTGNAKLFMVLTGFYLMGFIFALYRRAEGGITMIFTGVVIFMYLIYSIPVQKLSGFTYIFSLVYLVPGILFYIDSRQTPPEPKISEEDDTEEL